VSKYGDIIKKAREPENQTEVKPDNQITRQPDNQITRQPESQIEVKSDNQIETEQPVNLCVKVPVKLRRYWMSKAKEQGITVTSVIVEALNQKFGKP
jgi:hypothetical protein